MKYFIFLAAIFIALSASYALVSNLKNSEFEERGAEAQNKFPNLKLETKVSSIVPVARAEHSPAEASDLAARDIFIADDASKEYRRSILGTDMSASSSMYEGGATEYFENQIDPYSHAFEVLDPATHIEVELEKYLLTRLEELFLPEVESTELQCKASLCRLKLVFDNPVARVRFAENLGYVLGEHLTRQSWLLPEDNEYFPLVAYFSENFHSIPSDYSRIY